MTANLKHIISRRRKDKNGSEIYKNEKINVQSLKNYCFLLLNKQMCDVVVTVVGVKSAKTWKKALIYLTNEHLILIGPLEIKGEIMNETLNKQFIVCQI